MNNVQTASVYNKIAQQYKTAFPHRSEHLDTFLALLPHNARILDVGCGAGVDANYAASQGFHVTGVDASEAMLALAKAAFPTISFKQGDMREIDFVKESFAGIIAACSLIHVPKKDIPSLLNKFNTLLKKRGLLYVLVQAGISEEVFVDEPFLPTERLFLNVMSFDELKNALSSAGFVIIKKYERKPKIVQELKYTKLCILAQKDG